MPSPNHQQAKKRSKKAAAAAESEKETSNSTKTNKRQSKKANKSEADTSTTSSGSSSSLSLSASESSLNKAKGSPKKKTSRSNSSLDKKSPAKASMAAQTIAKVKEETPKYVIWRRPVQTIYYFLRELIDIIIAYIQDVLAYRKLVTLFLLLVAVVTLGFYTEGSHLSLLLFLRKKTIWYLYWVGLGVASSIGLGTGLHTFLLYLGPFIAQVTLAAYECNSLDFPEPPYPDGIICPNATTAAKTAVVSIWSIMSKVRIESFMWGAGTALGELPPYFMARTHALSTQEDKKSAAALGLEEDEEFAEFEHLLQAEADGSKDIGFVDRVRLFVFKTIKLVGFMGILACASIPNPLFDLAGITCGHFMVPFTTFFGATLIGKAVIKMHIQKLFVIFLFSEHHLASIFQLLARIPLIGTTIAPFFQEWLAKEKSKLHRKKLADGSTEDAQLPAEGGGDSILSWLLNKLVLAMVLFFIVSIVNSLAQRRYKRLNMPSLPVVSPSNKKKPAKLAKD